MAITKIAHAQQNWDQTANDNFAFLNQTATITPSKWVSLTPVNGFTGKVLVRQLAGINFALIEVKLDLDCNLTTNGLVKAVTLPADYTFDDSNALYATFPAQRKGTNTVVNCILHHSGDLEFYRDGAQNLDLTHVFGQLIFNCNLANRQKSLGGGGVNPS